MTNFVDSKWLDLMGMEKVGQNPFKTAKNGYLRAKMGQKTL